MNPTQRKGEEERRMVRLMYEGPDFTYFTNIHGDKTPEIQNDEHVNVSYVDPSSSNWVSVSGIAKISQDRNKIKELYSPATKVQLSRPLSQH
jgi:general stress protein 26